ncbi:hypothetical protein KCP73_12820 [Salmonella enterica subsp. enterica]|nr:hypothetical protein KCP73_12820 [Salmonella enterica subsp. enterica]
MVQRDPSTLSRRVYCHWRRYSPYSTYLVKRAALHRIICCRLPALASSSVVGSAANHMTPNTPSTTTVSTPAANDHSGASLGVALKYVNGARGFRFRRGD